MFTILLTRAVLRCNSTSRVNIYSAQTTVIASKYTEAALCADVTFLINQKLWETTTSLKNVIYFNECVI